MVKRTATCMLLTILSITLLVPSPLVKGQTASGRILGVLNDPSGSVIPGANVTLVQVGTNATRTTVTNDSGLYEIPALDIGMYTISAEAGGFKKTIVNNVLLTVGKSQRVDMTLQVGDVTENVSISSGSPLLHTDEATIGTNLNSRELKELPLQGRDVTALQLLAPGTAAGYGGGGNLGVGLNTGVVVNGGRITQGTSVTLDGGDNTNEGTYHAAMRPSVDAVEEFRFQTGIYSAENGRAPANLALVTKSGSNAFHGSVFEFIQNEAVNARNFFQTTRAVQRVNQFGFTLGGPVIKDKLFFFANYEGSRNRTPIVFNQRVPSNAERAGNFSGSSTIIKDPLTGQPFPGNIVPTNRFSTFARTLADKLLPQANSGTDFWRENASNKGDRDQYNFRIDYNLPHGNRLFGRYSIENFFQGASVVGQPLLPQVFNLRFQNLVIGETHIFGSRRVNEFRFTFHREAVPITGPKESANVDFLKEAGVRGLEPHNRGFPFIAVPSFGSWGEFAVPGKWFYNTFVVDDSATFIRGNHSIKVGGSFRRFQSNQFRDAPGSRGNWTFTGLISGNDWADVLLGHPTTVSWGPPAGALYDRFSYISGYIQDDWKVTPHLTLNLGLRYDLYTRQKEKYNRLSSIDAQSGRFVVAGNTLPNNLEPYFVASFPPGTIVPASEIQGLPRETLRSGDHNNFAPRIGVAWRPFGNKTVIRAGYGLYYSLPDQFSNTEPGGFGGRLGPWQAVRSITSTLPNIDITNPFGNLASPQLQRPEGRFHGGTEFRDGYYHQFSLLVERQIFNDMVVEIGYVGSAGRKLEAIIENFNNAPPGDPNTVQARRRFPNFGPISYEASVGTSDYNSMQVRVEKRDSRGLTISGNYTWAKAMFNTAQGPRALNVFDPLRLNAWRAVGNWDVPHRASINWLWDIPVGRGRRFLNRGGVLDAILGGWEYTGIANIQSGTPFSVTSSSAAVLSGTGTRIGMIADRIGDGVLPNSERTLLRWFDTSAFRRPQPQTFGNAGLNILRTDGSINFNLGLFKNFRIREGHQLQIRSEFYNAFNHPNFGGPNGNVDSTTFGRITSSSAGRRIQLGLKYSF